MTARYGLTGAVQTALLCQMLGEMADRLEKNRPGQVMSALGRIGLIQATTMDPRLTPALKRLVPEIEGTVVRREFAVRLREIAGAL
ncbi:hypothetical protein [Streptomyces sp. NPDC048242]|uniref:hypothetical protein n=1 Tax=Streptomyces sp. NPDC048242 TaxID=3155026 RepID=UPI003446FE2F